MRSLVDHPEIASAPASPTARSTARAVWLGRLGVLSCMGVYVALTRAFTWQAGPVDDAYITFRYAAHVLANEGPVFNPGERVEGFTSASWLLLMAALRGLGADLELASRASGLVLGLCTLALTSQLPGSLATRLWACLALATALPAIYHFGNGLETALMTALLTLLVCLRVRPGAGNRARVLEALVAALLTWTRPEGAACCAWWLAVELSIGRSRAPWRQLLHIALTVIAAFGLQVALRTAYYGDWIATSARAKLLPLTAALPHGLSDLAVFGAYASGGWLLLLGALYAVFQSTRQQCADASEVLRIGCFALGALLLLAASGGDSYELWRFYVPVLPCLCWLGARGLALLVEHGSRLLQRAPAAPWVAHAILLALFGLARANANATLLPSLERGWERHWHAIAVAFRTQVPRDTRLALSPVGIIPYVSGLYAIDVLGLTDPPIARAAPDLSYWLPGHQRHDGRRVLDRAPDVIMLANGPTVEKPTRVFPWAGVRMYERDIVDDPRFARDYGLAHLPLPGGGFVQVHVRKDFLRR